MLLISITDINFYIHSIERSVYALYCDAATLWLEKEKQTLNKSA